MDDDDDEASELESSFALGGESAIDSEGGLTLQGESAELELDAKREYLASEVEYVGGDVYEAEAGGMRDAAGRDALKSETARSRGRRRGRCRRRRLSAGSIGGRRRGRRRRRQRFRFRRTAFSRGRRRGRRRREDDDLPLPLPPAVDKKDNNQLNRTRRVGQGGG